MCTFVANKTYLIKQSKPRDIMRKVLISLLCSVLLAACHPVNPMEQLEAAVDGMRMQQRLADNRAFYDCYVRAQRFISLIEREEADLTKEERLQFQREKDEFYLISVTYQHAMGHHEQARAEMDSVREEGLAERIRRNGSTTASCAACPPAWMMRSWRGRHGCWQTMATRPTGPRRHASTVRQP